jgi:hypothetical protein
MKQKVIFFTVADKNNIDYAIKMKNSLKKFHPNIPLEIIGEGRLGEIKHPQKFYLMTPLIANDLIDKYDLVIKIDADYIITGNLSHIIADNGYDVGTVLNNNRIHAPVTVWDIPPQLYFNAGFVAMRSKKFIRHWLRLCMSARFNNYQFREQDLLNILCHYGDYAVKCFDMFGNWHGLIGNADWAKYEVKDGKLMFGDIEIKGIHWAGGNIPNKMTLHNNFKPEVVEYLQNLIKDEKKKA